MADAEWDEQGHPWLKNFDRASYEAGKRDGRAARELAEAEGREIPLSIAREIVRMLDGTPTRER